MAGDLPGGKYTAPLIGAWWPQPPAILRAGGQHWKLQEQEQEQYAQGLRRQWALLASYNQGHTADDLVARIQEDEKYHLDLAEKYKLKGSAFDKGGDAIDSLREGLRGIADDYNQRIANVENSNEPAVTKIAEVERLIAEANGFAAHKSAAAVTAISNAMQQILTAEGISASPQQFLSSQGLSTGSADKKPSVGGAAIGAGKHDSEGRESHTVYGGGISTQPHVSAPPGGGVGAAGTVQPGAGDGTQGLIPGQGGFPTTAGPTAPGANVPAAPPLTSPLAGGASPAGFGGPSPSQLGSSFQAGMMTGQPASVGAHKLSEGLLDAAATSPSSPQPPVVPPVTAPTITGAVEPAAVDHGSAAPATAAAAPIVPTGGSAAPATPAVVTGGPVAAPITPTAGAPPTPAGPLPAYGADLRPPIVGSPAVSAPTTPVSGAPVASSSSSPPSPSGQLLSTVQRTPAGQSGTSAANPVGASAWSAAAGAVAGDTSSRTAEQQRLQRLVDAVARQAPDLSWGAGLRDDGTTLLVGNIGSGWIPPNVKIPTGVNRLLEPAVRRPDATIMDLLGAVSAAAVHNANGFVAKPGPDDPSLTGDRVARSGPRVEELGPALVAAVRRRDGLPRIAQTLVQAATRNTGVTDNEIDLLHQELHSSCQKALGDPHDLARVADWMLLAAIEALIEGHESLAHYHVAWYEAVSAQLP